MRPGYKTTEFWTALSSQVLAVLVLTGVVTAGDQATLEGAITNGITHVGALVAAAAVVIQYIRSRTQAKAQAPQE